MISMYARRLLKINITEASHFLEVERKPLMGYALRKRHRDAGRMPTLPTTEVNVIQQRPPEELTTPLCHRTRTNRLTLQIDALTDYLRPFRNQLHTDDSFARHICVVDEVQGRRHQNHGIVDVIYTRPFLLLILRLIVNKPF